MLTPCQMFKQAFIARCIDAGYTTPAQILTAVKQADIPGAIQRALGGVISGGGELLGDYVLPAAIAGPPLLGAAAGYGLSKATDVSDYDVDEMKNQQVVDEYQRQAQRLRREGALRRFTRGGNRSAPDSPLL